MYLELRLKIVFEIYKSFTVKENIWTKAAEAGKAIVFSVSSSFLVQKLGKTQLWDFSITGKDI